MTKLREECGVFGIFDAEEASVLTTLGLHSLQHRGQEGAGIVTYDGQKFHSIRKQGLVGDNFNDNIFYFVFIKLYNFKINSLLFCWRS